VFLGKNELKIRDIYDFLIYGNIKTKYSKILSKNHITIHNKKSKKIVFWDLPASKKYHHKIRSNTTL